MIPDPIILAGIALGYVTALIVASVVVVRIGFGIRDFLNRNAR